MKKDYDFSKWDWMYDNDFMTYNELLLRLRKDLNEPEFLAYDLFVPHDEEEYQEVLHDTKLMLELLHNRPHKIATLESLVQMEEKIMKHD
jgi:hypothetical protein